MKTKSMFKGLIKKVIACMLIVLTCVCSIPFSCVNVSAATTYTTSVKTDSYVLIRNLGANKYLNVYGSKSKSGTNLTVFSRDNTPGEDYMFVKKGSYYTIKPRCATSTRVNIHGYSAVENANANIYSTSGNSTQSWIIEYVPSMGGYLIRSANNKNFVLTATGSSNGSNVCVKKYNSSNKYQIWTSSAFTYKANVLRENSNTSIVKKSEESTNCSNGVYTLYWPMAINYTYISGRYGNDANASRRDSGKRYHSGIDISGATVGKSDVYSVSSGTVLFVGSNSSRGKYVFIYHESLNITSLYEHLDSYSVKVGQKIAAKEVIGKYGKSGNNVPHLHFGLMTGKATSTTYDLWYTATPNKNNTIDPDPWFNTKVKYIGLDRTKLTYLGYNIK